MIQVILVALVSGMLIGSVGVGGVILAPALTTLSLATIRTAIAAAMAAYIVTGVIGTYMFGRRGAFKWREASWLGLGSMPAALLGSFAVEATPPFVLEMLVALAAVLSGLQAVLGRSRPLEAEALRLTTWRSVLIGAITGFLSSLTGTGGPVILMPILLWLGASPLAAVGLAQTIQIPIAVLATAGNITTGSLDPALSVLVAIGLSAGAWLGALLAQGLRPEVLRRMVGAMLACAGVILLVKAIYDLRG